MRVGALKSADPTQRLAAQRTDLTALPRRGTALRQWTRGRNR
jgi:hypothetical protein